MGNSKLEILLLTNPNTFSKIKCETWVMNLLFGGIRKIPTDVIINFCFWHSRKSIDSDFSKEDIVSIIESTSSKYNVKIKFKIAENHNDDYSSGVQFGIIQEFIDEMEDNSEMMFISDNYYCVSRDVLLEIYRDYKTSNLPFYTQIPITESLNFMDSDMHLFCYNKNEMKPFISEMSIQMNLKIKKLCLNFSADDGKKYGNFIFSTEFNEVNKLSKPFTEKLPLPLLGGSEYKIPLNEPGVLFSNIFWCNLYYTNRYNGNVEALSRERKYYGGTDNLNGYTFFRKNYTSSTELIMKSNKYGYYNKYHLYNYILLFETLLHKIYKEAVDDDTINTINEYTRILNNKFEWYHE